MSTPLFQPHDLSYAWIAIGVILLDQLVLPRVIRSQTWFWLRLPSVVLHEAAHFVVAALLLGSPKVTSLRPTAMPDGTVRLGEVSWDEPAFGSTGNGLIRLAPLVWYIVAAVTARHFMASPQSLVAGLAWLAAVLVMIDAAQRVSASDLKELDWLLGTAFVLFVASALIVASVGFEVLACGSFGVLCR